MRPYWAQPVQPPRRAPETPLDAAARGRPLATAASVVLGLGIVLRVAVERRAGADGRASGAGSSAQRVHRAIQRPPDGPADMRLKRNDAANRTFCPECAGAAGGAPSNHRRTTAHDGRCTTVPRFAAETVGRAAVKPPPPPSARSSREPTARMRHACCENPHRRTATSASPQRHGPGTAPAMSQRRRKTLLNAPAPRPRPRPLGASRTAVAAIFASAAPKESAAPRLAAPAPAAVCSARRARRETARRDASGAAGDGFFGAAARPASLETVRQTSRPETWLRHHRTAPRRPRRRRPMRASRAFRAPASAGAGAAQALATRRSGSESGPGQGRPGGSVESDAPRASPADARTMNQAQIPSSFVHPGRRWAYRLRSAA